MEFIITIDTEGDNQWDYGRELTVENIRFVPRFQELCEKYNIHPTYLVTSEVCEDPYSKELFSDYVLNSRAEIGAHLHSWTTPPFRDLDGYRLNDQAHGFANELDNNLLNEKIVNLTNQIEGSFGKKPLSFRSGRYGFNEALARILADNGYLVDSSVTPLVSWTQHSGIPGGEGGPDFIDSNIYPYYYNFPGNSLLEIPITILSTRSPLTFSKVFEKYYYRNVDKQIILKILRKLYLKNQPYWLRPIPGVTISMFKELLIKAKRLELPYLIMMFHSSELMPGCSIYRPDKESINELYILLEKFFIMLKEENIKALTLTEAAIDFKNKNKSIR